MALHEKNDAAIIRAGQWESLINALQKHKRKCNCLNSVSSRSVSDETMLRIMKIAKEDTPPESIH